MYTFLSFVFDQHLPSALPSSTPLRSEVGGGLHVFLFQFETQDLAHAWCALPLRYTPSLRLAF